MKSPPCRVQRGGAVTTGGGPATFNTTEEMA